MVIALLLIMLTNVRIWANLDIAQTCDDVTVRFLH